MLASALLASLSVASLNLCTDEYLLLLARPDEIASVSYLSHSPLESPLWRQARRHHANRGSIEQVLGQKPTLILTMGGGGRATSLIGRRIGIPTLELAPTGSIADVERNFRTLADALGDPVRARPWLTRMAVLHSRQPAETLDAIYLSGTGQSIGPDSPGAQWLRLAGLRQRALPGQRVSLEVLLTSPPQVLVQSDYRAAQMSRGTNWLDHPIIRRAQSKRLNTDGRAWTCHGPLMIAEIERLQRFAR